jgi:hypothetical protein
MTTCSEPAFRGFRLFSREGYAGLFAFSVLFVTLMKPMHFRPVAI